MRIVTKLAIAAPLLLIAACHGQADQSAVANSVVDNTVGTASDEMTNIDATTGSAANMAADVPAGGTSSDSGSDATPTGADAGSGDAAQQDSAPTDTPPKHAKSKATINPSAATKDSAN